ncbi:DNA replication factor C, large subunit [Panus rudis PR-1116 ss-1]|nr:DNA replication factor C, large subunit [Panus rudis PR-1116 ss-1]
MPTPKPTKAQGTDIRGFFGGQAGRSTPAARQPTKGSMKTHAIEISDDDDPKPPNRPSHPPPKKRKKPSALISSSDDEDESEKDPRPRKLAAVSSGMSDKPAKKQQASSTRRGAATKRTSDQDEFVPDEEDISPRSAHASAQNKAKGRGKVTSKPAAPKAPRPDDHTQAISDKPKPKFNWAAKAAKIAAGPANPGSKEVPDPAHPECLSGLSFVFTGELSSFSREEAVELAKRFGGRVTGQPSSRTSYVVLGEDAGPSKLAAIKKHHLQTLDEDGFLQLIATRVPDDGDEKLKKKAEKEQEAIKQAAREMSRREHQSQHAPSGQLWTSKYAPQALKEICGNKGQVEKLQQWLKDWPASVKANFRKPGKTGMNCFRSVLISGPPGIGKTTSAHLCAKLAGFTPIELNASDARSKKLVESGTNISNASLDGWMHGEGTTNAAGVRITDRTCLIMDEVDGMSAGDRGGVAALVALIKKTKVPIICIANDKGVQKLKSLVNVAFNLPFKRPEAAAIRSRILSIAYKEKLKIPANVVDQLVAGAQSDIRQVLNMLSTWKLSSDSINFDEGKALAKTNEKGTIMTPFDLTHKILGPYLFSATSRESLNDKMELYFHDHAFMPLFIQENYLKTDPAKLKNESGPEKAMKHLSLMDKAASSISDGDLVDGLIHGPEQHWSLMPLHAVCSTVRPASFMYGMGGGYGSSNPISFPVWLGQNSKQNKLNRQLIDMQARMRLKVSGDRQEIRQSYVPALFSHVVKPLMDDGTNAVDEVIDRMDEYFLNREDWDTVVELGVGDHRDEFVLKKISPATKTALTRRYNAKDHPIAFHKAEDLGKAVKKLASAGPVPDLEEALDVDEEVEDVGEEPEKTSDDDLSGDSLIKAPKTGKGGPGKAKATVGKRKGKVQK